MTNEELKAKQDDLMMKAIDQSISLQEKTKELSKFNNMNKNEQNRFLFKKMREENPISRNKYYLKTIKLENAEIAMVENKTHNLDFQGTYIMTKNTTNTVHFTGKGFLRLIKGDSLEIEVIKNNEIKL